MHRLFEFSSVCFVSVFQTGSKHHCLFSGSLLSCRFHGLRQSSLWTPRTVSTNSCWQSKAWEGMRKVKYQSLPSWMIDRRWRAAAASSSIFLLAQIPTWNVEFPVLGRKNRNFQTMLFPLNFLKNRWLTLNSSQCFFKFKPQTSWGRCKQVLFPKKKTYFIHKMGTILN